MELYVTPYMTPTGSFYLSPTNSGLGNALFQIASAYGIAKTLGSTEAGSMREQQ